MKTIGLTPLLNTPNWDKVFDYPMPLDKQGLLRYLEMVLLPNTKVTVKQAIGKFILQIETSDYPNKGPFYTDERFLGPLDNEIRTSLFPSRTQLLLRLKNFPKSRYLWGGNWAQGIPQIAEYYPIPKEADSETQDIWLCKGVDCSGLLYQVTDGFLPRNTSQLIHFGQTVFIAKRSAEEIAQILQPTDLIVWKGHVIIVEENQQVFESALHLGGTARTPLLKRLQEIMETRRPADVYEKESFVIRRLVDH